MDGDVEENCCERTRDDAVHTASWSGKADLYNKIAYIKYYNAILMLFMRPKDEWTNSIGHFFSTMTLKSTYKISLWEIVSLEIDAKFH